MKKLEITIEFGKDLVGAFSPKYKGVWGSGETLQEARQSVIDAIKIIVENNPPEVVPNILKGDYEIVWKYDIAGFLKAYKGILPPAVLHKLTGINPKLLHQYASGVKKPGTESRKKIEKALHELGQELLTIEL